MYSNLVLNLSRPQLNSEIVIQRQFINKDYNNQVFKKSSQNFTQKSQNVPLQLQYLKSHQQQFNLNDCIDNGHLLMNQINRNRALMSLRKQNQLDNLTISKIGSNNHTNNTSLNSSAMTYQNFILPQFNHDQSCKRILQQDDTKPSTMRKQVNTTSMNTTQKMLKNIKKPRSSLVITKRKQTAYDLFAGSQKSSLHASISNQKSKNHSFNSKKVRVNKDEDMKNKQFLQKMLQQLSKKYNQTISSSNKKTLQLEKSSNKKPTKKNQTQSSSSKIYNKKHKSQFFNNNTAAIKEVRQDNFDNILPYQPKAKNQIKNWVKAPQNHFMQINLNATAHKNSVVSNFIQQNRNDQFAKYSIQQTKKNIILNNNNSQKLKLKGVSSNQKSNQNRIKIDLTNKSGSKNNQKNQKNSQIIKLNERLKPQLQSKSINVYSILKQHGTNNNKRKLFEDNQEQTFNPLKLNHKNQQNQEQNFITFENNRSNLTYKTSIKAQDQTLQYYVPSFIGKNNQNQNSTVINYQRQQRYSLFGEAPSQKSIYPNNSRLSIQSSKNIRDSLDKKRKSFQKSIQQWDDMFQKQKNKFLKRQNTHKSTKLSSLNSSVINQIRAKIQKCILNDKETKKNQVNSVYIQKSGPTSRKNSGIIILKPYISKDKQKIQFFK